MRFPALLAQPGPLADAEAMLLVGDDEAEMGKDDVVLDEGMRADDDMDGAVL